MTGMCIICGKPKKIHARGMCYTCYHRQYQRKYYSDPAKREKKRKRDREYHRKRNTSEKGRGSGGKRDTKDRTVTDEMNKWDREGLKRAEERILRFMRASGKNEFTPAEIQSGTDLDMNTVRYLLRKMKTTGKLVSPRWGTYSPAEEDDKSDVPGAVLTFLDTHSGEFTPAEIADGTGIPVSRLRGVLMRLKKEGRIVSPRWGRYCGIHEGENIKDNDVTPARREQDASTSATVGKKKKATARKRKISEVEDAIISFLSAASKDHSPAEIADGTGIDISRIRPVLTRLKKEGKIRSPRWGRYAPIEPRSPGPESKEEGKEEDDVKPGGCVFFPGYREPIYDDSGNIIGCLMGGKEKICKGCPDNPMEKKSD